MVKPVNLDKHRRIVDSNIYKASLTTALADSLCDDGTLRIALNEEIVPEFPREAGELDHTRILVSYHGKGKDVPTTITCVDDERLNRLFDIDRFTSFSLEKDELIESENIAEIKEAVFSLINVGSFMLRDLNEDQDLSTKTDLNLIWLDALAALLCISFNDPLDIWLVLSEEPAESPGEITNVCYVKAVKPRPRN